MSLPECRLALEQHQQLHAEHVYEATESRRLASGAKWNQKVGEQLDAFNARLRAIANPGQVRPSAAPATRKNLGKLFGAFGIAPAP